MKNVDEFIPQPDRPKDKDFLMPVEDVFSISGRGTVVTGRVESGVIKTGEEIEIVGIRDTRKSVCTGVEMFRKLLDSGEASPESKSFLNISTPVQTDFLVSLIPTISISSPVLITPDSTLPVTTVPLPEIENTSSTGIKKSLSFGLSGCGINSSTFFINSKIEFFPISSSLPSTAASAEP